MDAMLAEIEHMTGVLSDVERAELALLIRAGITPADVDFAISAWGRARRVTDDWGYIRTVMLHRAAERMVIRDELAAVEVTS